MEPYPDHAASPPAVLRWASFLYQGNLVVRESADRVRLTVSRSNLVASAMLFAFLGITVAVGFVWLLRPFAPVPDAPLRAFAAAVGVLVAPGTLGILAASQLYLLVAFKHAGRGVLEIDRSSGEVRALRLPCTLPLAAVDRIELVSGCRLDEFEEVLLIRKDGVIHVLWSMGHYNSTLGDRVERVARAAGVQFRSSVRNEPRPSDEWADRRQADNFTPHTRS